MAKKELADMCTWGEGGGNERGREHLMSTDRRAEGNVAFPRDQTAFHLNEHGRDHEDKDLGHEGGQDAQVNVEPVLVAHRKDEEEDVGGLVGEAEVVEVVVLEGQPGEFRRHIMAPGARGGPRKPC